MKILLDTHIALWAIADSKKLSEEATQMLEAEKNKIYYSIASVWEVAIKHKIKPEQMPISEEAFLDLCEDTGFELLPVEAEHIFAVKTLKRPADAPKHNDPFDRILLAQAKSENMNFLTHDSLIPFYKEKCVISI